MRLFYFLAKIKNTHTLNLQQEQQLEEKKEKLIKK